MKVKPTGRRKAKAAKLLTSLFLIDEEIIFPVLIKK